MNPAFIKSYAAAALIAGCRFIKFAAPTTGTTVAASALNTDPIIGVSDAMGAGPGMQCDVHLAGLVSVQLGGPVSAGDPVTSDAEGRAVLAVSAAATSVRVAGIAHAPGVAGDIINVWLAPSLIVRA